MDRYFASTPDSLLFGPQSPDIARGRRPHTSTAGSDSLARQALPGDRYPLMERFVGDVSGGKPRFGGAETDNTTLAWLEYLRAAGVEQDYATGSIAEVLADVNDRRERTDAAAFEQRELVEGHLRDAAPAGQPAPAGRGAVRFAGTQLHADRGRRRAPAGDLGHGCWTELNAQAATQLIWTMNASVDNAFADFDRQRGELQQYVTREREALVEQLRATGDELVRTTSTPSGACRQTALLFRAGLGGAGSGGLFALGFWLGGVRAPGKNWMKKSVGRMMVKCGEIFLLILNYELNQKTDGKKRKRITP